MHTLATVLLCLPNYACTAQQPAASQPMRPATALVEETRPRTVAVQDSRPAVEVRESPAEPVAAPRANPLQALASLAQAFGGVAASPKPAPPSYLDEILQEPAATRGVRVSPTGLIDVHVRDTEISAILEMISHEAAANIVTSSSVQGKVSVNLTRVSVREALDAILIPNHFAYRANRNTIFVGTPAEVFVEQPQLETRVFRLNYLSQAEALELGKSVLSSPDSGPSQAAQPNPAMPQPTSPFGPIATATTEKESANSGFLVVTDLPERLNAFADLLRQVDVAPRQVLIEATILRATLNDSNRLGIDFTLLGGVDFQGVASSSDASTNLSTGALPADKLQNTTFNVNTDLIQTPPQGGFTFGIIHNGVAGFVRALEQVTDVTVVANPKLVALNRQESEVIVGRRDGYLTTTVTQTAAVQTVNFLETGTQIRVRPIINHDGTVRLEVHPKDSNGGLTAANLPFEETTEADADILVRDGHTVLIGGLFRERTVHSRDQVPVLGSIPLAGMLFQHTNEGTVREEVIILLTVRLLKDTDAENEHFEGLIDDVERVRTGARLGLVGAGRERLAQAYFQEALEKAEQGDYDRALFNVRMALHNHPRHIGAIKLRERLLSARRWDDDGTRMHVFLLDLLRQERDAIDAPPDFGRPALNQETQGHPAPSKLPPPEPELEQP